MPYGADDTIIAIATPPGRGGIGVVRLSGPEAVGVAGRMLDRPLGPPRQAVLSRVVARGPSDAGRTGGSALDEVVAIYFQRPASYTGEDVVELSAHGSPAVLTEIVRAGVIAGARLAGPGEFTLRAFLSGRVDLVQAEAVADLVEAVTPLQARAAFDQLRGTLTERIAGIDRDLFELIAGLEASMEFPDESGDVAARRDVAAALEQLRGRVAELLSEGARGRVIREGRQVTIVGAPNVGKSSLFNRLIGVDRAIVASDPGTTRDLIAEVVDIGGLQVTLVDSAGMRAVSDGVEEEGVRRARGAAATSDAVIVVLDRSRPLAEEDAAVLRETAGVAGVVVANKVDRPASWSPGTLETAGRNVVPASMVTGAGLAGVRAGLTACLLGEEPLRDPPAVTNVRHMALLRQAEAALGRACAAAGAGGEGLPEEFVVADLREAQGAFEEVTGRRTTDDLIVEIFSRFCIGK